jgi:hypothetical protein
MASFDGVLANALVFRYPYPLFEILNKQQRAIVFAASAVTFTISALCLKRLYDVFNGSAKAEIKKLI